MDEVFYGSIEAGGTKFVLAVADKDFNIITTKRVPTLTPEETLPACIDFFKENKVNALGIGSFGPIDINKESKTYGSILATPKPGWSGVNMVDVFTEALNIPIYFTTDVNSSAYGEYIAGNGKGANSLVYFTIGTGIGGGAIQNGEFIGGISHAEMGHAPAIKHPEDDYSGGCPFHKDQCFEGLAAGPTIEARTGEKGENIPRTDRVFDLISYYAGQIAASAYLNLAPERIIFGGSVISDEEMPKVREYFSAFNNGYTITPDLDKLIVKTGVADNGSATLGNFALAQKVLEEQK